MLAQLLPDKFSELIPMYHDTGGVYPLILAVLEGSQRGQVFVSDDCPQAAFVINNFGFARLVGIGDDAFDHELAELLAGRESALGCSYLLWYDPPARWRKKLNRFVGDAIKRRERVRFEFRSERARYVSEAAQCPEDFALREMDHCLLSKAKKFALDLESRFWSSADDFVANALGACLVNDNHIVSFCYAAAVADGLAEVDVVTDAEFRGRGFATIVSQQFVRQCLGKGIKPTWDCFVYNAASMRLAEALGFGEQYRYPFYSFNVPTTFDLNLPAAGDDREEI